MNFLNRTLVEIDFLSRQTMVFASGTRTTNGTIAAITPADGLTFVLLGAGISTRGIGGIAQVKQVLVLLENNTSTVDRLGGILSQFAEFGEVGLRVNTHVRGDHLDGDGIKEYRLEVTSISATLTVEGAIYGYERNT